MAENWVTRSEFAKILGVTPKTVSNYCHAGMPARGVGKKGSVIEIETAAAVAWYVNYESNKKPSGFCASPKDHGVDYAVELALEKQAQRRLKELELEEKQANLLPREAVEQIVWGSFNALVQSVLPIGRKIVPELMETQNPALAIEIFESALFDGMKAAAADISELNINAPVPNPPE